MYATGTMQKSMNAAVASAITTVRLDRSSHFIEAGLS
jgi:hypothetical protein